MSSEALKTSKRLSPNLLDPNQQAAITALYEGNTLLIGNMGSGKTVVAATAIAELLGEGELNRVLIITTPKIANSVWKQEFDKWEHTHFIDVRVATSEPSERLDIFRNYGQVVVATFNILPWIRENNLFQYFDGLLIDETTKLKTPGGKGFKAIRSQLKHFKWRCGLTGTPVSEDFSGLYAQMMLIDGGKALGTRHDTFMNQYFYPTDFKRYNWVIKPGADKEMLEAIKGNIHIIPDYRHKLPPITYHLHRFELSEYNRKVYDQMAADAVTEYAVGQTAAVQIQKLQQIAAGFIYTESGTAVQISDERPGALTSLLYKLRDQNVIIVYNFKEDLERLRDLLERAEELTPKTLSTQVDRWNRGEIKHLLIHPKSAGHGLQLEQGGHTLIWYTPQWSNDQWEQTNARLWRTGQKHPVDIYTIEAANTVDELINARIESKAEFDHLFHKHLDRINA